MRRAVALGGLAIAVLAVILLVRAAAFRTRQTVTTPAPRLDIDAASVAERLAGGLRLRTVSHQDAEDLDGDAFRAFHRYLERAFPRTHRSLERETVAEYSLLYTWRGSSPELAPLLLLAHSDVVPVEAGSEPRWTHPPFAGNVADGFLWGRGAMDDKGSLFCILEAVEYLLERGFQPRRTLLLAFGHDEEVGGDDGAVVIAARLQSRGVRAAAVLDEGGAVVTGAISVLDAPIAVIGIAEKGSVSIALDVEVEGGHSSTPPRHSAVGILASALHRLEANPMPGSLDGTTRQMLEFVGPELSFPLRIALANLWLFGPLVERAFRGNPATDAMLRTTTAATIFRSGVKENVLPSAARAIVNFRILPGEGVDDVTDHVRRTVNDERVTLQVGVRSQPRGPSPVSPVDSGAFRLLARTTREIHGDVPAVPYLVVGGTDARHYTGLSDHVYRFAPFSYGSDDLKRIHGTNERVSLENLVDGVRFYVQLIRNADDEVLE
jgi:carboxypeptidase PM20D1